MARAGKRRSRRAYEERGIDLHNAAYEEMTKEQLAALAAKEAKSANQRMRRLARAGYGGSQPTSRAYGVMQTDISRWFPDAAKFSESKGTYMKMRVSTIKAILRDFDYYKSLKTATVSGTKKAIKAQRKGFEDKTGVKFISDEQWERFWKSGVGKFLFTVFESSNAVDFIFASPKDMDEIVRDVQAWMEEDGGDRDNQDEVARLLGFESLADARSQADKAANERRMQQAGEDSSAGQ